MLASSSPPPPPPTESLVAGGESEHPRERLGCLPSGLGWAAPELRASMHLTGDEMGTDHNIQLREPVFEDGSDLREEFKQLAENLGKALKVREL